MGLGPNWHHIGNILNTKSYQMFCTKRILMLTDLKVPSFACKCVIYKLEELKFEGLEMQK